MSLVLYGEFLKLSSEKKKKKKAKNLIQKWAKDLNRHFFKEDMHMEISI